MIPSVIAPTTVGNTDTMLFITGITFLIAPSIPLARFSTSLPISASGFPKPAIKFCHDADKLLKEPSIVPNASSFVAPVIFNSS